MTAKALCEFLAAFIGPRPVMTRKDLARHYGRSLRTIDRWKEEKKLPRPIWIHGPMWKPEDLASMEDSRR